VIRLALIDDHPLILKILRQDLSKETDIAIIWETTSPDEMYSHLREAKPDVLVLDLFFGGQGFEPVTQVHDLHARYPAMKILILTAYDDPIWIAELIEAGVHGYVVKSDDFSLRLAEAIRTVFQGRTFLSLTAMQGLMTSQQRRTLTSRERAVLRLAAEGHANPQIADILGIADGTVRNHISNIYSKLDVTTREEAIQVARRMRELPTMNASTRHELRTPLHVLLGLARLLRAKLSSEGALSSEQHEQYLEQLIAEAERLDGLIEQLVP